MKLLRWAVVLLLVLSGGTASAVYAKRTPLRIRWAVFKTASADEKKLRAIVAELAAIGTEGIAALEGLAFSEKVAEPGPHETLVRQVALDGLIEHKLAPGDRAELPDMFAPFVDEALGLARGVVGLQLGYLAGSGEGSARLDQAAARVLLDEPDAKLVTQACAYLHARRRCPDERACAVRSCRHDSVRRLLFWNLVSEGFSNVHGLLEGPARFPDEGLRVGAARLLWREGDASVYGILVRALRAETSEPIKESALAALELTNDRRLARALANVAARDGRTRGSASWHAHLLLGDLLGQRAKCDEWTQYVNDHEADLPPQLDPESDSPIEAPR